MHRKKLNPTTTKIVFVHWFMPKLDGIDFIKQVRQESVNSHIQRVMATSNNNLFATHEAIVKAGADIFVGHPFTPNELREPLEPLEPIEPIVVDLVEDKKANQGLIDRLLKRWLGKTSALKPQDQITMSRQSRRPVAFQ